MKHRALVFPLLVSALLAFAGTADAKPFAAKLRLSRAAGLPTIIVPTEWAGVWAIQDTVFDCLGAVTSAVSENDTLCAGQNIFELPDDFSEIDIEITCDGEVTPTLLDVSCSGTTLVAKDCLLTYTFTANAVRTGETYDARTATSITFTGTGIGCDAFPGFCVESHTTGTRILPEPTAYCATPVEATTWGQIKSRYR